MLHDYLKASEKIALVCAGQPAIRTNLSLRTDVDLMELKEAA